MTQLSPSDDGSPVGSRPDAAPTPGHYSTKAVLALILAIVSVFFLLTPVVVWLIAVPGVILGHLAVREVRDGPERGTQLAVGGLVVGYLAIGLALVLLVGSAAAGAARTPDGRDHGACVSTTRDISDQQLQRCIDSYGS